MDKIDKIWWLIAGGFSIAGVVLAYWVLIGLGRYLWGL